LHWLPIFNLFLYRLFLPITPPKKELRQGSISIKIFHLNTYAGETTMNGKTTLLLAALMSISTVAHGITSPQSMYRDIKKMIEDPLNGNDDVARLKNVQEALQLLEKHKKNSKKNIIYYHATVEDGDDLMRVLGSIGGTLISFGNYLHYLKNDVKGIPFGMVGVCFIVFGIAACSKRHVNCYFTKKKIEEINTVIVKLKKLEANLKTRIEVANMAEETEKAQDVLQQCACQTLLEV
jgi:adenylate cyclase class IV